MLNSLHPGQTVAHGVRLAVAHVFLPGPGEKTKMLACSGDRTAELVLLFSILSGFASAVCCRWDLLVHKVRPFFLGG